MSSVATGSIAFQSFARVSVLNSRQTGRERTMIKRADVNSARRRADDRCIANPRRLSRRLNGSAWNIAWRPKTLEGQLQTDYPQGRPTSSGAPPRQPIPISDGKASQAASDVPTGLELTINAGPNELIPCRIGNEDEAPSRPFDRPDNPDVP